jgi:signal transduction histidine kinase
MLSKEVHHGPLVTQNDHAWAAGLWISGGPPASAATGGAARLKLGCALPSRNIWRWVATLFISLAATSSAFSQSRQIVILFDERIELPGLAALNAGFTQALTSGLTDPIEIYREQMDLSRFDSEMYRTLLRDEFRAKYAGKKIDVVVAVMEPSLNFLLQHRDEIFPGIPIVFCGIDRKQLGDRPLPADVTGVLLRRQFAPTVELVARLQPDTERLFVVSGTSEFDKQLLAHAREEFQPFESRFAFTYLTDLPLPEILARLSKLPPRTVVLYTTMFRDGGGQALVPHNVAERISAASNAPVYGFLDQYVGHGLVGGRLYGSGLHAEQAAGLVLKILSGRTPQELPLIEPANSVTQFDARQLQRWKINPDLLPPDSTILFRDPSVWDRYRTWIIAGISVFLVQALLITGLLANLFKRRRAERSLAKAEEEALHHREQITLLGRVSLLGEMTASLAHELGQPLSAISTNANAGMRYIERDKADPAMLYEILGDVVADAHRAHGIIQNVRNTIKKGDSTRRRIDLNELVRNVAHVVRPDAAGYSCEIEMSLAEDLPPIEGDPVQIQQVLVNLVGNAFDAMRQIPASQRKVEISTSTNGDGEVRLCVRDHGTGIGAEVRNQLFDRFFTTKEKGLGMGLAIVRSIVESHGGQIQAENVADGGARFHFTLPVATSPG